MGRSLLARIERLASVASFTWRAPNPSLLVADRLEIAPGELVLSTTGGTMPQKLLADAARSIQAGTVEVVGIVGAEAMHSRGLTQRDPATPRTPWTRQDLALTPAPIRFGTERPPLSDLEIARGVTIPVEIYPLLENAHRARMGWTLDEHRRIVGALWSSFSEVAATNEHAWLTAPMAADDITRASAHNRMIAEPYTKLMVANLPVDMGAALLLCSLEAARAAGVDEDRLVFPQAHAFADDHFFVSDRPELDRSVAVECAGAAVLAATNIDVDAIEHVDLYSCFPVAVEIGAAGLGLALDDPARPLTVTGGLTFAGGPGNNYVSHSLATMAQTLRSAPGAVGVVTGLSYFSSSHSVGLYSTTPPRRPFVSEDLQTTVDATPTQLVDPAMTGEVEVETYTIVHDRDGLATRATLAVRDAAGARSWGQLTDVDELAELAGTELCGRRGVLDDAGIVTLR